jgi:hypothetical protein
MNPASESDFEMTLDPPGRIAIIGAGPLGIEAALYGRFLGYEVEVFEKGEVGQSLKTLADAALPMLPDRCLSPLAISALKAQDRGLTLPNDPIYPLTVRQWIDGLLRIASTDLLHDRISTHCEVAAIELVAADLSDADDQDEDGDSYVEGDVPPDFRLTVKHAAGVRQVDVEAVVIAIGTAPIESIAGYSQAMDSPYLFRLGQAKEGSDEARLHQGWHRIVSIYARLAGRGSLDLYRPARS